MQCGVSCSEATRSNIDVQLYDADIAAGTGGAVLDPDGALLLVHYDPILEPGHQHDCQAAPAHPDGHQVPLVHLLCLPAAQRLPATCLVQVCSIAAHLILILRLQDQCDMVGLRCSYINQQ